MKPVDDAIRRLERIAAGEAADDSAAERDSEAEAAAPADGAPVAVCCECDCQFPMQDGDDFRLGEWFVCPNCLYPIVVAWLCDEDHAHTDYFDPDLDTPEGRDDALIAVRQALAMLPDSGIVEDGREAFERAARDLERHLLDLIN